MDKKLEEVKKFLGKQNVQWIIVAILFLVVLISSTAIRTSNLDNLVDSTTGEYIPLALDPFYFLRMSETIVENNWSLPDYDAIRYYPGGETPWSTEIMPWVNVAVYKTFSPVFPNSLEFYNVISPTYYYFFGLIVFFALIFILTKSKFCALISSTFLAFNPAYLYRTMAGFSDHESIGMLAFFIALLVYSLALYHIDLEKTKKWKTILWGIGVGITTALTIASWGGVANFLFIIIPLSFFLVYIFKIKNLKRPFIGKSLIFYFSWILSTPLFGLILGQGVVNSFKYFMKSQEIISLAVLGFIIVDTILIKFGSNKIKNKFRILYSLVFSGILGMVLLPFLGKNPFTLIFSAIASLISPFKSLSGTTRLGSTVAENAQPYLSDWVGQMTPIVFWLFFGGVIFLGFNLTKRIRSLSSKVYFGLSYILMVCGIIFSRSSSTSILNGDSFFSQIIYLTSLGVFGIYFFYIYIHENFKWSGQDSVLFALMFFTIVSGRAAARVFFLITPFVCFFAAYFLLELWKVVLKNKENSIRILLGIFLVVSFSLAISDTYSNYNALDASAKYTSPSANAQWQDAMKWVRENTSEDSVFSHWWDYGYWVETLGERRTVADGGHFQSEFGNHRIGRYILTTPKPETAYSMFKTFNISYLLIDPTDLGKYSAYSKIGGDENYDRFSQIPTGIYDSSQIRESNGQLIIPYALNGFVDEDIVYSLNGTEVFIPGPTFDQYGNPTVRSSVLGFIVYESSDKASIKKVVGIYGYNGRQYSIPIRYVYFDGKLTDFGFGLDAVIDFVPSVASTASGGVSMNVLGSAIYLSPKVKDSLFAQLYLLDDAFGNYNYLTLAHKEENQITEVLKAQGMQAPDFVYYQGLQGPIKIWETNYPPETNAYEDLLWSNGSQECYGCLDKLW
jgi:asparagine N-glycosylation enzyme membrane subunit Stt3